MFPHRPSLNRILRHLTIAVLAGLFVVASATTADAARRSPYKPILYKDGYNHEKYIHLPNETAAGADHVRRFRAYTALFDGIDDDDGDGDEDRLGIPHFVTYELRAFTGKKKTYDRPSPWITDLKLARQGIAPWDDTYLYSRSFRRAHPNWYERGHLCMKDHAGRLGSRADWNTHTLINAVPQRAEFNQGIWRNLEDETAKWADTFGSVWIIAGPIFYVVDLDDADRIGESFKGEMRIAVPDGLFKIVIRELDDTLAFLAFVYPQDVPRNASGVPYDHTEFLTSVDEIERLTGFDFVISDDQSPQSESVIATELWSSQ